MGKYILRRILFAIPVLFAIITVTFALIHALPGGPFDTSNQRPMPPHIRAQLEQKFGLHKPVFFNFPSDGKGSEIAWGKTRSVKGHSDTGFTEEVFAAPQDAGVQLYGAYELVGEGENCLTYLIEPGWALIAEREQCIVTGGDESQTFTRVETHRSVDLFDAQFWQYLSNIARLDFGPSLNLAQINENRQVTDEIRERVPVSMQLGIFSTIIGFSLGIPLGVMAAVYHNSPIDYGTTFFSVFIQSIPAIVLAPILILIFAVQLNLVPEPHPAIWTDGSHITWPFVLNGLLTFFLVFFLWQWWPTLRDYLEKSRVDLSQRQILSLGLIAVVMLVAAYYNLRWWLGLRDEFPAFKEVLGEYIQAMLLPVMTIGTGMSAGIARLTRASLLQIMGDDFIQTARAKGLRERRVIYIHALKNSLIPVATAFGPLLAGIVTGSFIVEQIFSIPGMGNMLIDAVGGRDYTTIMGVTIFYSTVLIFGNILTDIMYTWLDPRIRFD